MHKIEFPKSCLIDRIVAKEKIFKQVTVSEPNKRLFAEQVERIRCLYELTQEKLNLATSQQVPKIFVLQVIAKDGDLDTQLLQIIDKAFQVPVIFELQRQEKTEYAISYRRRNEADHSQWVFSAYFFSGTVAADVQKPPLALSLEKLYHHLLVQIVPFACGSNESPQQFVERTTQIQQLQKQADSLQKRVYREKQFNRQVTLNKQHRELVAKIEGLKAIKA